jgi:hypothetical protein
VQLLKPGTYVPPLKSPCFDMRKPKVNTSSSLKERIRLNKMLTISPKTGNLIGVNPDRKREDPVPEPHQQSGRSKYDQGPQTSRSKYDQGPQTSRSKFDQGLVTSTR